MLDRVQAERVEATADGVRAWIGPLAFRFACAQRDSEKLCTDRPVELVCAIEIAQDGLRAYCFADEERRELYEALCRVGGVGSASALAVLDCGEVSDTLRAIASGDGDYFRSVPRLGKARIASLLAELGGRYRGGLPAPLPVPVGWLVEAREALVSGGLDPFAAERALLEQLDVELPTSAEAWLAALDR